jgi:hypothetical protein
VRSRVETAILLAAPTRAEIERVLATVKADPNLATERTIKTLRWTTTGAASERPAWFTWIAGLFRWIDQSARVLVWCAAILLAGFLVVSCVRMIRSYRRRDRHEMFVAPTHVRELDIRPETLPADVGAAARGLWNGREQRAALALLYRGLLSRLAHVHRLPIRDSTTEGDCLALAASLTARPHAYASHLVGVWQRFTYGRQDVATAAVHELCDGFAAALDGASAQTGSAAAGEVA